MEIQFRITKIVPFRYPRWLQWQPSWNSSNDISSQTISQNELKFDGRHQRFRFAKIVPFRFPRWLSWGPSLNSSNAISSETISQIELKLGGRHRNKDIQSALVAQLDALSDWRPGGRGFNPRWGWQHSLVEIDHKIFSTVILSLQLIQEGQLSVSGKRMCTILVNSLEDKACPINL